MKQSHHVGRSRPGSRRLRLVPALNQEATADYLRRWLQGRRSLRPATLRSYEGHIRRYLVPHLGDVPIGELSTAHLDAMYDVLLDGSLPSALSVSTVHRVHSTLQCALNHALRHGVIDRNPATLVELPPSTPQRPPAWSATELAEFLDGIIDDPHHALFALMGTRGLRRGEALGLRWRSVDLDKRELSIVERLAYDTGVEVFGPPKSKAGRRLVTIDERLARTLYLHSCRQRLSAKVNGWGVTGDTCVFTDEAGVPLKPLFVTRHFNTLVEASGARRVRLHDLRHTSASIGLASGETLLEVSRRLGHSSVAITADIYTEVSPVIAHASAERLTQYLRDH